MLDVGKLCQSARECLGWPYVSPGSNDRDGIDCSGLFVKVYRDQGASIYHGSNTIYRKYCRKTGRIESSAQLKPCSNGSPKTRQSIRTARETSTTSAWWYRLIRSRSSMLHPRKAT